MSKTMKKEIANLNKMKLNDLQAKFAEVTGEKTRSFRATTKVAAVRTTEPDTTKSAPMLRAVSTSQSPSVHSFFPISLSNTNMFSRVMT